MKWRLIFEKVTLPRVVLTAFVVFFLAWVHLRGVIVSDEGYILNSAERILSGQVPYRDFDVVYTPVSLFVTTAIFKLLGVSIFSGRVLMIFVSVVTFGFIVRTVKTISRSQVLGFLAGAVYLFWGPGQINFPWPTMFAVLFGVLTTFLLVWQKKLDRRSLFLAGVGAALVVFSKQSLGLGIVLGLGTYIFLRFRKKVGFFVAGGGLVCLVFGGYLFLNGAILAFWQNLYVHTFEKIVVEGTISTPVFIGSTNSLFSVLKAGFYLLPGGVSGLAIFLLWKRRVTRFFPIPIFLGTFYLLGIRPVTDYNHLVPLIAITGLGLALIFELLRQGPWKKVVLTMLVVLALFGGYQSVWGSYYRWGEPLVEQREFFGQPKIGVWVSHKQVGELVALQEFFQKNTKSGEKIFVNLYMPMVYFVTGRQNATRFDYYSDSAISAWQQQQVVSDLKDSRTRFVVGNILNGNEKALVNQFLMANYHVREKIGGFLILERN